MTRVAVLASGGGTNLQALIDYQSSRGDAAQARLVLVASDRADAGAVNRAAAAGIATMALDRAQRTTGLHAILDAHAIELIVLAGYLRMVPHDVTATWRGRIVNVHPALLPAFGGHGMYGTRVHEAVITSGACLSGPTIHFVDERYDEGPIIAQWPVAVLPDDTPEVLASRVLEAEHMLLPRVVEAVAAGVIRLAEDGRVKFQDRSAAHFAPAADLAAASRYLDQVLAHAVRPAP
jgi:formyltetrahydrofolate-dependent phosphoribosylglycinamide formyltransferase